MAVAVHQGNLFRTLISGVIIMGITLWIATQTIGLHTQLAANAGALKAGGMVASMDGVVRRLLAADQLFTAKCGWLRGHRHHLSGRRSTDWRRARGFIAAEKAEKALPRNKVQACLDLKGERSLPLNLIAGECYEISGNPC